MCNGFMKNLIFLLHMLKGNKNFSIDGTISSLEMEMDKEICKSKL